MAGGAADRTGADGSGPADAAAPTRTCWKVTGVTFDPRVHRTGHGDNFLQTWAADDLLYVNVDDGRAWGSRYWNNFVWRLRGGPEPYEPDSLPGYPGSYADTKSWYGFGIISVEGVLYHWISRTQNGFGPPWYGSKLLYSRDLGKTWMHHDGATTGFARDEHFFFWKETPENAFAYNDYLQAGRDYALAKDEFVYVYGKDGDGPNKHKVYLARVHKRAMLRRSAYEFFAGIGPEGEPRWTPEIARRVAVHSFPAGYIHSEWRPSVVYNQPLDLYVVAAGGRGRGGTDRWQLPASLGLYYTRKPWGPFRQFHYTDDWIADEPGNRLYQPVLSPKFIGHDGREMHLIYSDCMENWGKNYRLNQQKITLRVEPDACGR